MRAPRAIKPLDRPLSSYRLDELPRARISREQALAWKAQMQRARSGVSTSSIVAPPDTTSQFFDLTTVPRPPQVGESTKCQELHPFWTPDQQTIYFASNNVDPVDTYGTTLPPAGSLFHIYAMDADGSLISQVTGTAAGPADERTGNQFYPSVNVSQTKLIYTHRPTTVDPFELYVLDFATRTRDQLTGVAVLNNPLNSQLIGVEHPFWSPTQVMIAFAARDSNIAGDVRNIYVVDTNTKVVTKLTHGSPSNGVESIDPSFHPESRRIIFAANTGNPVNGPAVNTGTGDLNYVSNPLQDLRLDGSRNDVDHNLFTIGDRGASAGDPILQITQAISDDIEPSYEHSRYPPGSPTTTGAFNGWLAFASLGRQPDSSAAVGKTYDIYFNNGDPETLKTPIRLFTPDTNAGAIPLNQSDERYPTWSAGLPPQNPINRIVFSSNRQNNTNDLSKPTVSRTDTDLWGAEVTDIDPPTLFMFDDEKGEVLHIANAALPTQGRRLGTPGDRFFFYAKVKDLQYGTESVWLQIKDPDGPSTDSQGVNHRLYGVGQFTGGGFGLLSNTYVARTNSSGAVTHRLHLPWETDFDGIGVTDYQYFRDNLRIDDATNQGNIRMASKLPGVDDSVRWSGNQKSFFDPDPDPNKTNRPPVDAQGNARWLRMKDDGVAPDLRAGDGIYSASWVTPDEPSDYYVDLIAYDKAFDPNDTTNQQNWIIYDNVWGFSTQTFQSQADVLYVDDNGAGQKWPRGLKGEFRPFPTFRYGTESDIIDRPDEFHPKQVVPNPVGGGATLVTPNLGTYDFLTPRNSPDYLDYPVAVFPGAEDATARAYHYDFWRILAKGPLPENVLSLYTPTVERQPGDVQGTPANYINRPVPTRAVVWNAPYTGDIFSGSGSILDQATQTLLTNYRNRAGRLVIAGGDILWALTVDGSVPQPFAQDVLGADFNQGDDGRGGRTANFVTGGNQLNVSQDVFRIFPELPTPPFPYWAPFYDPDPIGTATGWGVATGGNGPNTASNDGTPFQVQDFQRPRSDREEVYANRMNLKDDPATGSKTVFMSFSLASLGRRFVAADDTPSTVMDCMNYRSKISHSMFCWMFSAELVGQIRNLNGGGPIAGAWVQAYVGNTLVGSAFSRQDGTYKIRGLPIVQTGWSLVVSNPGFRSFNKTTGEDAHGLEQAREDVFLIPAPAGSLSGKVTDTDGQPIAGARIKATIQASPLYTGTRVFRAVTAADGTYTIPSLPVATYDVIVDTPYPTNFGNPQPASRTATVNPAQETRNVDFTLSGMASGLTVHIFQANADGSRGPALAGADVVLLNAAGQPIAGQSGQTDSTGTAVFTNVPAGVITVSASKVGFQERTATVRIPQDSSVDLVLVPALTFDVYGLVQRAIDNLPLAARDLPVTVQLLRTSGAPTGVTATVFAPSRTTPVPHNYVLRNAPAGQYILKVVGGNRYQDAQIPITIGAPTPIQAPVIKLTGKNGVLTGTVREDRSGTAGVAVRGAKVEVFTMAGGPNSNPVATATTDAAGRWTIAPTSLPSDLYLVRVTAFGYAAKMQTNIFVAGNTDAGVLLLARALRGQVFGLVRRRSDQVALGGIKVEFYTLANSPFGSIKVGETTSFLPPVNGPDGRPYNYSIGGTATTAQLLPVGDYEIRVGSDPRFAAFTGRVTVVGGQRTRADVDLVAQPGVLQGTVKDEATGRGLLGATVTVRLGAGTVATLTTDGTGHYQTTGTIPPGTYTITASAAGYVSSTVSVSVQGPTTAPDIRLRKLPPSVVTGIITSSLDNAAIGGATVELLAANGQGPAIVTATSSAGTSGTPPSNFRLTGVSAGTYVVRVSKPGWTGSTRTITVTAGQDLNGINLQLVPSHVFGQGLLLISLPEGFAGRDAATLFGLTPSTFKSAYYLGDDANPAYAIYPDSRAREFTLGKGMFVRFNQRTAFTAGGNPAPNTEFPIPLRLGWNLIGSVRKQSLPWLSVAVRYPDGSRHTMQQAYADGVVQNGLFAYLDGYFPSNTMDPFSGYFVKALRPCTLLIPVPAASLSRTPTGPGRTAVSPAAVKRAAAEIHAAGLGPAAGNNKKRPQAGRRTSLNGWPFATLWEDAVGHLPWRSGLG